ncbi:hypothetical protein [Arenicella xantha]|uniref:ABC-2 type transport system permease protein n=1 Tax=Arenicella xantha TaxID=644221 RepID=A0A395JMC2_9GAMM|nr:hypothetical protein [Arenicella xantha]RBP52791.1 ABC-2 type transport system permease protein [Arenicella xantha]
MNKIILGFKREYWEYQKTVIVVPLVLSALIILASGMATLHDNYGGAEPAITASQTDSPLTDESNQESGDKAISLSLDAVQQRTPIRFTALYIGLSWLVALIYLLSSLYSDRRDNSVLYWKSLPVSETQTVLTKFAFGSIVIAFVSLLVAWAVYILLTVLGWGAIDSLDGGQSWRFIERTFDASRLFIWSSVSIVIGAMWGAPYFAFALLVSSYAKRVPFLLWILSPLVVAALEGIFFRSTNLLGFYLSHFPFAVLKQLGDSQSLVGLLNTVFVEQGGQMLLGIVVAVLFLCVAIWNRNHRFELKT